MRCACTFSTVQCQVLCCAALRCASACDAALAASQCATSIFSISQVSANEGLVCPVARLASCLAAPALPALPPAYQSRVAVAVTKINALGPCCRPKLCCSSSEHVWWVEALPPCPMLQILVDQVTVGDEYGRTIELSKVSPYFTLSYKNKPMSNALVVSLPGLSCPVPALQPSLRAPTVQSVLVP